MVDRELNGTAKHPIQIVARRTGLTADVIRVWERRYEAVSPHRTPTNRRLYSDVDVERLQLLRRATLAGRRIGDVADLPIDELRRLVAEDESAASEADPAAPAGARHPQARRLVDECLAAVEALDADRLTATLSNASVMLSAPVLLEQLLMPLMDAIGRRWRDGSLRPAHEHLTTSIVRSFLGSLKEVQPHPGPRPDIVVTTPAGQLHELGALTVAVTAALDGWSATYLGPNLPAEELAVAVKLRRSVAVALSVVHPGDDPGLAGELRRLRRLLADDVALIVGGSAAQDYEPVLKEIGALRRPDLASFRAELQALRTAAT